MTWWLWVCVLSATGVCQVEKHWPTGGKADCMDQISSARVDVAPTQVSIERATSVDLTAQRVILLCRQAPPK